MRDGFNKRIKTLLKKKGWIMSSVHEAFEEFNIAVRISASVAGVKQVSEGGVN